MVKLLKPVTPFPWAIVKPPALAVSGETVEGEKDALRRSRASSVGFTPPDVTCGLTRLRQRRGSRT
jgi:hypothetical protein